MAQRVHWEKCCVNIALCTRQHLRSASLSDSFLEREYKSGDCAPDPLRGSGIFRALRCIFLYARSPVVFERPLFADLPVSAYQLRREGGMDCARNSSFCNTLDPTYPGRTDGIFYRRTPFWIGVRKRCCDWKCGNYGVPHLPVVDGRIRCNLSV